MNQDTKQGWDIEKVLEEFDEKYAHSYSCVYKAHEESIPIIWADDEKETVKSFIKEKLITAHNEGREEVIERIKKLNLTPIHFTTDKVYDAFIKALSPNKDKV